jgi:hypothetical protein
MSTGKTGDVCIKQYSARKYVIIFANFTNFKMAKCRPPGYRDGRLIKGQIEPATGILEWPDCRGLVEMATGVKGMAGLKVRWRRPLGHWDVKSA